MSDTIKGAIIGALITTIGSILIFFLGNFSTQATLEKNTVETLSEYFESVDKDMSYKQALQTAYAELVNTMLDNAIAQLDDGEKPIVHSDRGCHYRWPGWGCGED